MTWRIRSALPVRRTLPWSIARRATLDSSAASPRFEVEPYLELGICTVGRDGDTAAQMKAGAGPVIEDEAKVLVDPSSPFRDQQHPKGRHEDIRWTARRRGEEAWVRNRRMSTCPSSSNAVKAQFRRFAEVVRCEIARQAREQVPVFGRSAVESTGVIGLGMNQP